MFSVQMPYVRFLIRENIPYVSVYFTENLWYLEYYQMDKNKSHVEFSRETEIVWNAINYVN